MLNYPLTLYNVNHLWPVYNVNHPLPVYNVNHPLPVYIVNCPLPVYNINPPIDTLQCKPPIGSLQCKPPITSLQCKSLIDSLQCKLPIASWFACFLDVLKYFNPIPIVQANLSYVLWVEFVWEFRRLIWLVARLNLNGRCSGRCYVNSTTFCCISQLFLVKCMNFCSENKITLKGYVTLTCNNQFFINFELNW